MADITFTPSELTKYIHKKINQDKYLNSFQLIGEISNHSSPPSGHHYFVIKDDESFNCHDECLAKIKSIIEDSSEYHITKKLAEGEGVITNNVIHKRTAFTNSENKNRLLYRLRSKKRVAD